MVKRGEELSNQDEHEKQHEDDHEHDHDHEDGLDEDEIVILHDEEGNEHEFLVADTFEVNDRIYVVLVAADGESDEGFIFRVEEKTEDGDTFTDFIAIEDDAEWAEVEKEYNSLLLEDGDM